jgi:hypothetical protein
MTIGQETKDCELHEISYEEESYYSEEANLDDKINKDK